MDDSGANGKSSYVNGGYENQNGSSKAKSWLPLDMFGNRGQYEPNHNEKNVEKVEDNGDEEEREHWGSKWEFIFSCVGLSVGIGNVWRFPSLAYENGGGSFLIPYFILLMLIGKPMYYMELALGQFAQRGPVSVWKFCPIGVGVGMAQCLVSLLVAIYYNVIMSYCLYYIFASFQSEVPWSKCESDWFQGFGADDHCYERSNLTSGLARPCKAAEGECETATEQFYKRAMLGFHKAVLTNVTEMDNGTEVTRTYALWEAGNIGEIKWDITLCLLLSWLIVCACLVKGIKSSGKVVYFTATFPYLLLIILMIFGLTLEGAKDGVAEFFKPKWSGEKSIADPQVWRRAAEQMFYSLSISWGGLIMFGSYNKFNHKVHITATAISTLDFLTSIIAGVVIFSILGQLKLEANVENLSDVVKSGPGLAFVVFSDALSRLPVPQLWAVMFFFMLFLLGLDSEFAMLETTLTAFYDNIAWTRRNKPIMVIGICVFCFLISLPNVTYSGVFVFKVMDDYGGSMAVMWIAIIEMALIMWVYGAFKLNKDFDFMLGTEKRRGISIVTGKILEFLWIIIPILLSIILAVALNDFSPPKYTDSQGYIYLPAYAHGIGIFLVCLILLQIPIGAIAACAYYYFSSTKRLSDVFRPADNWGPGDSKAMKRYKEEREPGLSSAYINNAHLSSQSVNHKL